MNHVPSFSDAVSRADALFSAGYKPLGATLIARSVDPSEATYQLGYRSWRLIVRLSAPSATDGSRVWFSCRLVGRSVVDVIHDAIPLVQAGSAIVDSVPLGVRDFEGVAEAMAEVYHRVVHRTDVQRAIRRDPRWPISS